MHPQIVFTAALCLIGFWPSMVLADVSQYPLIGWHNLATTFSEGYQKIAAKRLSADLAKAIYVRDSKFRLNPILNGRWSQNSASSKLSGRSFGISQDLPFGSSLGWKSTQSDTQNPESGVRTRQEVQSLELKQQILKGGPWQGLAEDRAAALQRDIELLQAKIDFDAALTRALNGLADTQQAQATLSAREKALERAQAQHQSVRDLVQSGYRAKADLLVTEASLIRTQVNRDEAQRRLAETIRQLSLALFFDANAAQPKISEEPAPRSWSTRLADLSWPELPPADLLASQRAQLAKTQAHAAQRVDLPELSIALQWNKTRDRTNNSTTASERLVEIAVQTPIISNLRQENSTVARLNALQAQSALTESQRNSLALKAQTQDRLRFTESRLSAAERLYQLALQTLQIEQQKYADGNASIAEVRRVQEDVERAQIEQIAANRDFVVARIEWAQATGRLAESLP